MGTLRGGGAWGPSLADSRSGASRAGLSDLFPGLPTPFPTFQGLSESG